MRHVILITAYTQLDFLLEQLSVYDTDKDFSVYVHWDKKTASREILKAIGVHDSVKKVCSIYRVTWGGRNLLAAMLLLAQSALKDMECEEASECFVHSISGTDIIIKSIPDLKAFFARHKNEGFMEFFELPTSNWDNGGMERLTLWHPLDRLDIHQEKQAGIYRRYLRMQRYKGVHRSLPNKVLYGGSCWWSLPLRMAEYWLRHKNDEMLYERMESVFAPEEIHPQTILLNSPYRKAVHNTSLHYICWDYGTRGTPAVLEDYDLPYMLQSSNIWARKIGIGTSDGIKAFYKWFVSLPTFPLADDGGDKPLLRKIADFLLSYAIACPLLGLMDGIMGAIVFLSCYGKICRQEDCVMGANVLMNHAISKRGEIVTADFNNGTFGFAYALEWLCRYGFIVKLPLYEDILCSFDEKVMQIFENEDRKSYFNTPFWMEYYQISLYVKLRGLPCADAVPQPIVGNVINLMKKAGAGRMKKSIGMAGLSGCGFMKLRTLYNMGVPPFVYSCNDYTPFA